MKTTTNTDVDVSINCVANTYLPFRVCLSLSNSIFLSFFLSPCPQFFFSSLLSFPFPDCPTVSELGVSAEKPKGSKRVRIPDDHMTASSSLDKYHAAFRGRMGLKAIGPWQSAWCAGSDDDNPYLQIQFGTWTLGGRWREIFVRITSL